MLRLPPRQIRLFLGITLLLAGSGATVAEEPGPVHYELTVLLDPETQSLRVRGEIRGNALAEFELDRGLKLDPSLTSTELVVTEGRLSRYRLNGPQADRIRIAYAGPLAYPVEQKSREYARSFSETPGIIEPRGAVLSFASGWVPNFGRRLVTAQLKVETPEAWRVVTTGRKTSEEVEESKRATTYTIENPLDDLYLVAGPFHVFSRPAGSVEALAYLRVPDANLAQKYLEATSQYLEMYRTLIGRYPFSKFALVENFWETGYGMPSFTLLGPRVIRLPFILHSSYPHEILHKYWGNSVFVDYAQGNWCEGLTAYLADHLVKEGYGRGREYRFESLVRYRSYVQEQRDFPLIEFRSRHSAATEAVGYGKAMMIFHMIRREIGDDSFARALQRFYRKHRFQRATFLDLGAAFAEVDGRDVRSFVGRWIKSRGALKLGLESIASSEKRARYRVTARPRELAEGLRVTVAVSRMDRERAEILRVELKGEGDLARGEFEVDRAGLASIDVDPEYDLFRELDPREIPSTLGDLFGSNRVTIVLPTRESTFSPDAWRELSNAWSQPDSVGASTFRVVTDRDLETLPEGAVWILGSGNLWADRVSEVVLVYGATATEDQLIFGEADVPRENHSYVFTGFSEKTVLGWIGSARADAIPGLIRKLPHYGKYSYLAFEGAEPTNVVKGRWPTAGSSLSLTLAKGNRGTLPKREPLARLAPVFDSKRLEQTVVTLAADEFEGRGVGTKGLVRAAEFIAREFEQIGLKPLGADYRQPFQLEEGPGGNSYRLENIVGYLPGSGELSSAPVVVGAHYDHLGRGWPEARAADTGQIFNGADDNASGVAVLLEVARLLAETHQPQRSIIFVAFSGEECGLRGSRHFVSQEAIGPFRTQDLFAMINIDSVGRLEGRKFTVFGASSAYEWPHIAMGVGFTTGVESQVVQRDFGSGDHRAFLERGIPAIHLFGGAHDDFHRPTDDAERIDLAGLVKAATWLRESLVYLSDREAPLKVQIDSATSSQPAAGSSSSRRVALGTLPDFTYEGEGVRIESVREGSPAGRAGLRAGDLIVEADGEPIRDLVSYSDWLKRRQPGDRVTIRVNRNGQILELEATLEAR